MGLRIILVIRIFTYNEINYKLPVSKCVQLSSVKKTSVSPKDHFMILRNCWHFWSLGFCMNFCLKKGQSLQTARTFLFCSSFYCVERFDGGFLGYEETIVEIYIIKMGEITSLNSHLAKWNSSAKHPGPHYNPYRDHILGVGSFLVFFSFGFAVFKNQFPLFLPQDAEDMGELCNGKL